MQRIAESAAAIERIVAGGETVYGVNTGFGLLANTRIPNERLAELQTNLILSHSAGLGDPLPRHVTRLMIVLKLLGLGRGHSGVRPLVVEALQRLLDADAMPLIPSQGSVGASGDLAPLAHLISALMGYGRIDVAGEIMAAASALDRLGLDPLQLGPKEGLALINGTQASDRAGARRFVPGRARLRRGHRRGRSVGRRAERQRQAVRPAHLRASRPARPDRALPRQFADLLEGSEILDQPHQVQPGAGPLQLPLPAAGHGRRARSPCRTPRAR